MSTPYKKIAALKTPDSFQAYLSELGIDLPFDAQLHSGLASPLARTIDVDVFRVGNRFCILPMEGWDGTLDGHPSDLTIRRWKHFGISGAKLIWGGEAVAVRHDGRANPNQLLINSSTVADLAALRQTLVGAHTERFGSSDDLLVGLQLTHSGRYARPNESFKSEPLVAYQHPVLDRRFAALRCLSDEDLDRLVDEFVAAAGLAYSAGFQFVDIKHCHGYLGHELLSAVDRPGRYGGSFENRTRFLRNIAAGIRAQVPQLALAVRVSIFDAVPYKKDAEGVGVPEVDASNYRSAFGLLSGCGLDPSLEDGHEFLQLLEKLGIHWVCVTAGSPYYCPHIQRPAMYPPSDGYLPPEDPLVGVARQIRVTQQLKRRFPGLVFVGSAYSYLQEWLPHVAQNAVREGRTDFVGLGRIVLSYPDLPADVLEGNPIRRKLFCRTFSDCTSGPRNGLVSGCFPLDPFYGDHPHADLLRQAKGKMKAGA